MAVTCKRGVSYIAALRWCFFCCLHLCCSPFTLVVYPPPPPPPHPPCLSVSLSVCLPACLPHPFPSSAGAQVSGVFFSVEREPRVRVAEPNLRCVLLPMGVSFCVWGSACEGSEEVGKSLRLRFALSLCGFHCSRARVVFFH